MKQRTGDGQVREYTAGERAARDAQGQAELSISQAAAAKARLAELDLQSVRSMRELLIAKHADDPRAAALATIEDQAAAERAKLPQQR